MEHKIPAVKFEIEWSEGMVEENQIYRTWYEMHYALRKIWRRRRALPDGRRGGYYKTKCKVTWSDGSTYGLRYDIGDSNSWDAVDLGKLIQDEVRFFVERPIWMEEERWLETLRIYAGDGDKAILEQASESQEWLDKYELLTERDMAERFTACAEKAICSSDWDGMEDMYSLLTGGGPNGSGI